MIVPAGMPRRHCRRSLAMNDRATTWRRIMAAVTQFATPQGPFGRGKGSSVGSSSARRPRRHAGRAPAHHAIGVDAAHGMSVHTGFAADC
jgi:hypothetical protein